MAEPTRRSIITNGSAAVLRAPNSGEPRMSLWAAPPLRRSKAR